MKLYKILIINLLMWGIPAIPSYYTYKVTEQFVKTPENVMGQFIGIVMVFLLVLIANHEIFWNKYYHIYLNEDYQKDKKDTKTKML